MVEVVSSHNSDTLLIHNLLVQDNKIINTNEIVIRKKQLDQLAIFFQIAHSLY